MAVYTTNPKFLKIYDDYALDKKYKIKRRHIKRGAPRHVVLGLLTHVIKARRLRITRDETARRSYMLLLSNKKNGTTRTQEPI
jgi:hypothetical protein